MDAPSPNSPDRLTAFQISSTCACGNLRKSARAVTQVYDELLRPLGLRATQFSILVAVRLLGPVTVNRLAEATVMDRTTLTRNLKPLDERGWVQIEAGLRDRRQREVTLSEEGAELLERAMPRWHRAQARIADGMGDERLQEMIGDLALAVQAARGR